MKVKISKPINIIVFKRFDVWATEDIEKSFKTHLLQEDNAKKSYEPQTTTCPFSTIHLLHKFSGRRLFMSYDWYSETLEIC